MLVLLLVMALVWDQGLDGLKLAITEFGVLPPRELSENCRGS